jgi:hypothetical protein
MRIPDEIIKWAVYGAINGYNTFLDEKLAQRRFIATHFGAIKLRSL